MLSRELALGLFVVSSILAAQSNPGVSPTPQPAATQAPAASAVAKPEAPKAEPSKSSEESKTLPAKVDPHAYLLGAEDVINVRVWREPDLSGQIAIRPDGKIAMPLINEVQAAGLTPVALAERLKELLSKFVNNPQVVVSLQEVRSSRYYVSGDGINRSGAYPLAVPTHVFEAITLAGGFRDFANKKKIIIVRGSERLKFNYSEVVKGKNLDQNILLENGDEVVVN